MIFSKTTKPRKTKGRARRRRQLSRNIESLESRQLLASLAGEVWADSNGDGVRQPDELPAANVRVYLDANEDGAFNTDEEFVLTDTMGEYVFGQVLAGTHVVRLDLFAGQEQTSPLSYLASGTDVGPTATGNQLFEFDINGSVRFIAPGADTLDGLTTGSDAVTLGLNSETGQLFDVDVASGLNSEVLTTTDAVQPGLATDPQTGATYAVVDAGGALQLTQFDFDTGTLVGSAADVPNLRAINFGSTFHDFDPELETANEVPLNLGGVAFASTLDSISDGTIFGLQGNTLNQYSFPLEGSTATQLSTLTESIEAISFNSDDQLFGVSSSPSAFHAIDASTGQVGTGVPITFEGNSISAITGFDIAPDGTHYIVDSTHLYTFDPLTGIATQASNRGLPPFSPIFTSLTATPDGALFATLFDSDTPIAEIDPVTGLATRLGDRPAGAPYASVVASGTGSTRAGSRLAGLGGSSDLTFDWDQQRVIGFDDTTDTFFQFDTSGIGTVLSTTEIPVDSSSIAYNGSTFIMFDDSDPNGQRLLEVNPDTGSVDPFLDLSAPVAIDALDFSTLSTAYRIDLQSSTGTATNINFGVLGEAAQRSIGDGLFINELLVAPQVGDPDSEPSPPVNTDQYIEFRGRANEIIPDGTYFVVVEEDTSENPGSIHGIFDLSGLQFGSNGILALLQNNSSHTPSGSGNIIQSTSDGFGGLPNNMFQDASPLTNNIDFQIGNNAYMLIQSDVAPVINDDIDANDDGFADPAGAISTWEVLDSLSLHPNQTQGAVAYGNVVFVKDGGNGSQVTTLDGVEVGQVPGFGYAGRIGDSIGSLLTDWVVGTPRDEIFEVNEIRYGLDYDGADVPEPRVFAGRDLDHVGDSNFIGGVRGNVALAPLIDGQPVVEPAQGVTVIADVNGNGRADLVTRLIDPDSFAVGESLTNALEGVTFTEVDQNGDALPDEVISVAQSVFGGSTARVFGSSNQLNMVSNFPESNQLQADFIRPVRTVALDAVSGGGSAVVVLEAYDEDDNLIGSVSSMPLTGTIRERLTINMPDDSISYIRAYSASTFTDLSGVEVPLSQTGRIDLFEYRQTELTAVTNEFGFYELEYLLPDEYDITFINGPSNRDLIGAQPVPITVDRYENFLLGPNVIPVTDDLEVTIDENSPFGTNIGFATGADDEGSVNFSIVSGESFGILINEMTGELTVGPNAILDFETTPTITLVVGVTDELGATVTSNVTINLNPVNEDPIIEPTTINLPENTLNGTAIGRILASDPDVADEQILTYTLAGGTGLGILSVDPDNGLVRLIDASAVDFESQTDLTLVIRVSDNGSPSQAVTYIQTVTVDDENDAPVLTASTIFVDENSTGVVGVLEVTDADADQQHDYNLEGGTGAGIFDITDSGLIVVRPNAEIDFETETTYTLDITVVDDGSPPLASAAEITINILNIDEPAELTASSLTISEDATPGTLVSTLTLTDPEGDHERYAAMILPGADSDNFELEANEEGVLELRVAENASFDFETQATNEIIVEVIDTDGASDTEEIPLVFEITDANDAPSVDAIEIIVSEAAKPNTIVGTATFSDQDVDETFTSVIIGGSGESLFDLDPNTHEISLKEDAELDADVGDGTLSLEIEVTDSASETATGVVTIRLNDVDEPPVFFLPDPFEVPAARSGGFFELTLPENFVVDPEGGDFEFIFFDELGQAPSWLTFDPETRTFSGTPSTDEVGDEIITMRAFELGEPELTTDFQFTIDIALGSQPFTNERNPLDVNDDSFVRPFDVLAILNFLSKFGVARADVDPEFTGFVDVNGDGFVTPFDALMVINELAAEVFGRAESVSASIPDVSNDRDEAVDAAFGELGQAGLF